MGRPAVLVAPVEGADELPHRPDGHRAGGVGNEPGGKGEPLGQNLGQGGESFGLFLQQHLVGPQPGRAAGQPGGEAGK